MSMVEVLISALLLACSSSAALGVWSRAASSWQQSSQRELKSNELELMRLASHRWLAQRGAELTLLRPGSDDCLLDADALAAASDQALPLPQGLRRQWVDDPDRHGIWQELSVVDVDGSVLLQRRQLFSPAAYGLCRS